MLTISRIIDTTNTAIGKFAAWFILISILISAANAMSRYFFEIASNAALEAQWQLFSFTFLFCGPWVLLLNEHIRIDILNNRFPPKIRYWIDIFGHSCVLIPFCLMMVYISVPWAIHSYELNEQSFNSGGLPQWPAKMMVPFAFILLLLQGVSELIKRVYVLLGKIPEPYKNLGQHGGPETAILEEPAGD